jgi:hypothetical protein
MLLCVLVICISLPSIAKFTLENVSDKGDNYARFSKLYATNTTTNTTATNGTTKTNGTTTTNGTTNGTKTNGTNGTTNGTKTNGTNGTNGTNTTNGTTNPNTTAAALAARFNGTCFACVKNNYRYCSADNTCRVNTTNCTKTVFDNTTGCPVK